MKNVPILFVLTFLIFGCSSSSKLANNSIYYALVGQNEKTIYKRLGIPSQTESNPDGGKTMVYEFHSTGMFETPYKSNITYRAEAGPDGQRKGWTYTTNVNTAANDPKYTIHQTNMSWLKVFLDKEGKCTKVDHNLSKERLEMFYEQFKIYVPNK